MNGFLKSLHKKQSIDNYLFRIQSNIANFLKQKKNSLELFDKVISANNIENILNKGFVILRQNEEIIKRKKQFNKKTEVDIQFADGRVRIKNEQKK